MPTVEVVSEIAAGPARVFDAARDMDLHQRSVQHTGERAVGGVTTGLIGLGEQVTFEARHLLLRVRATFRITSLEAPHRFVDEMVEGIMAHFRHTHLFEPTSTGTRMRDVIEFRLPWGVLGKLATALFFRRYLHRLVRARAAFLKEHLERAD